MRAESKVKMRASEKRRTGTQATNFFLRAHEIFSIKRVTREIDVAKNVPIRSTDLCFFPSQFRNKRFYFGFE